MLADILNKPLPKQRYAEIDRKIKLILKERLPNLIEGWEVGGVSKGIEVP